MEPENTLATGSGLVGLSAIFRQTMDLVRRVARTEATVLIAGETGTGKELVARSIHYGGPRRDRPFIPVNCGALPDSLLENELFGHCRGAYTDARQDQLGLVQLAEDGSMFLDEIDSLTPKAQVALLRFLEERRYRPLGSSQTRAANVRIIAASNRALPELVESGEFRRDLYYRIKLIEIPLPPLRSRCGDAALLADYFLLQCAARYSSPPRRLSAGTRLWMDRYPWPGNVRELENLIHREFLLCDHEEICIEPPAGEALAQAGACDQGEGLMDYRRAKAAAIARFDRDYLMRVMAEAKGNVSSAARLAGKERRALGKLLKRYNMSGSDPTHLGID
jgi:two-component system response regulator GlrR